jgi:hypothetical protein
MSTFDAANYYYSGQGVVMIGKRDPVTGQPTGLRPIGNVSDLKITVASTVIDHKGSQDGQRAIDKRLQTEIKATASMTMDSWISANVAKALRGDTTAVPAGTSTNEAITGYPGLVTGFKYIMTSGAVVKQASTTLTQYTNGIAPWDYKLNANAGSIMLNDGIAVAYVGYVPTSPVGAGAPLTVTYTYAAQDLVDSLTEPLTDSWVRFEGLNTLDSNNPVIVDVFRFTNDPLKEMALISDTFGQFVLEGAILKDDTRLTGSKYFAVRSLT